MKFPARITAWAPAGVLWLLAAAVFLAAACLAALSARSSQADDAAATNIVEQFQRQLDAGTASLAYGDDGHGYLGDLLRAFHIPRDSQLLVFSASSFQFDRINQKTPRALYYQDNVSVGSVQDGKVIEIIAADKDSGVAFYTLDVAKTGKPRFERQTGKCIICHGFASSWAPGLMVANMDTGPKGQLLNLDPNHLYNLTDDRTPFAERYGGWYVTGTTGAMAHRGNVTLDPGAPLELPAGGLNVTSLADRIDTSRYYEPGSDIVSLLTLEHQSGFVNLVTRINAQYRGLNNKQVAPGLRATEDDIDASIKELLAYMTFADEVPLPSPVKGSSTFTQTFPAAGPHDGQGRSLRQFDLTSHVFRYPLSFMVYSQTFDDLNPLAKARVWRGLYDALKGAGKSGPYSALNRQNAAAAINILAATKSGLPDFWKTVPERGAQRS